MGEQIFNFVLSDINGIPALPVFIGNYLLDLLALFFPILLLLAAFIMVYTGFSRGSGDWKQTAQQVAPTGVAILIIIGILSMRTPYSAKDGGNLSGNFWEGTNSYTIVEMMNIFLDTGALFADALTHKLIYGSIMVNGDDNNGYNGYFPTVLQEIVKKKNEADNNVKEFLINKSKREDIVEKIDANNKIIASTTKNIVSNLQNLGIVDNFRTIRTEKENIGEGISAYKYLLDKTYIAPAVGAAYNGNAIYYFKKPRFSGDADAGATIESNTNMEKEKEADSEFLKFKVYAYKPNFGTIKFDLDDYFKTEFEEDEEKVVDVISVLKKQKEVVANGQARLINPSADELLTYLNPNNFEQEENMLRNLILMLENYKDIYLLYVDEIEVLKNKVEKAETLEEKTAIGKTLATFVFQAGELKFYASKIATLYKSYVATLGSLTKKDYTNDSIVETINQIVGAEFYAGISTIVNFTAAEVEIMKNKYADANFGKINWYEEDKEKYSQLISALNKIMQNRAFITNIFYDKYKELLKDDTFFQTKLGFRSETAYARVFLPQNDLNALSLLDDKKEELLNNLTKDGKTVAQTLEEDIKKQFSSTDLGQGQVIHWTDLGKHYGTFKQLYSPMVNNIMVLDRIDQLNYTKVASMAQFMGKLEPSDKVETLLTAGTTLGVMQIAGGTIGGAISDKNKENRVLGAIKGFGGGVFDAIKTIGGVYIAILFINVILPAFIWMFVVISYYIEMSIYLAVFPIGLMFMVFQSYRQSLSQFINLFLGFMLMPIILVSMFFIVLYIDMLLPMFFKQFLPFFSSGSEIQSAFGAALGGADSSLNKIMGTIGGAIAETEMGNDVLEQIGSFIYTVLSMIMSVLLLLTFFRANEYMSKILNVTAIGNDNFNGRDTINKFGSYDKSGLTKNMM